ncbi:MAG TPA: hypothetical protein VFG43_07845 [Geminicoccaceae bacterium]|nr:hypothetical protein [Geminicoccaceae bacterium]
MPRIAQRPHRPSPLKTLLALAALLPAGALPAAAQPKPPPPPEPILACAREAGRSSALAIQDAASRGWRITTQENIVRAGNGDWSIPCPEPPPSDLLTGDKALHRLCQVDAAILACLQSRHGWRKGQGQTAGLVFPPG